MNSSYKVVEIIGSSKKSWRDAADKAFESVATRLEDIRIAEVKELDVRIEKGKIVEYRAKLSVSFKFDKESIIEERLSLLEGRQSLV